MGPNDLIGPARQHAVPWCGRDAASAGGSNRGASCKDIFTIGRPATIVIVTMLGSLVGTF